MKTVTAGSVIKARLTGRLENGEIFDSTEGEDPVELRVGSGLLLKAFEEAILGMGEGQKRTFTVPAAQAYGARDESLERALPRADLPADYAAAAGDILSAHVDGDPPRPVRVKRVDGDAVVIDLNHPLAGQDLTFDIEIVEIA